MAEKQSTEPKKGGRKPKFDYTGKDFLDQIAAYAKNGFTDKEIAASIGLAYQTFSEKKNEYAEIADTLAGARATVNAMVRKSLLTLATGTRVVRTYEFIREKCSRCMGHGKLVDEITGKRVEKCPDCGGVGWIRTTEKQIVREQEVPPSLNAINLWLTAHDEEWKKAQKGNDPTDLDKVEGIDIKVTYNKKEDLELQQKAVKDET